MTKTSFVWLSGLVLTAAVAFAALGVGTSGVDFTAGLHPSAIVLQIRLPRVLLGALVGAALATAGVVFQAILRNPLADPYVVGVSGGAALGGVVALAVDAAPATLPLWGFAGACVALALLLGLAHLGGGQEPLTLLLAGVVFNAFAAALVTLIKTLVTPTKAQEILFWLMGAVGTESEGTLLTLTLCVGVSLLFLLLGAGPLNLLALGDDDAAAHGLPVPVVRMALFASTALLVGAVVSVAGMVAFVGLVVPHTLRLLVGADHRRLLPAAMLGGACFVMVADAAARAAFIPFNTELPVGVVTACAGGPFFLALLLRRQEQVP